MVLYDIFINQTEDQKGFSLFWAGGLAGKLVHFKLTYKII
jgi:hypothetical protein